MLKIAYKRLFTKLSMDDLGAKFTLGIQPHFIKVHIEAWTCFHADDLFTECIPFVLPIGVTDGSSLHHDIFDLAEYLAAVIHIQGPVGLLDQLSKFGVRPARFIPGADGFFDVGQIQHHGAQGAMIPGGDAQIHLGPLAPVLIVGHGIEVDSKACRCGLFAKSPSKVL